MNRCVIVCAGDLAEGILQEYDSNDFYIAADGGYKYLLDAGIKPDLFIGDKDSLAVELQSVVDAFDRDKSIILPVEKDDTDSLAAAKEALKRGITEIHILGGTGGWRSDHTMANYQCLKYIKDHGGCGVLKDLHQDIYVLKDETMDIRGEYRKGMSLFSLGDRIEHVTLRGFYYSLEDGCLENGFPLGVSNHIVEAECSITVKGGCGLLFLER